MVGGDEGCQGQPPRRTAAYHTLGGRIHCPARLVLSYCIPANPAKDLSADSAARAGRYIRQPTGYRAFPLPPAPPVQITGEIQRLRG